VSHTRRFHDIHKLPNRKGLELFLRGGLYLLPSFNYPCRERGKSGWKNANPTVEQLTHASEHLRNEVTFIQPPVIFALGKNALFTILQAYGSSTSEAGQVKRFVTKSWRISPLVGSTFSIYHGSKCAVFVEKWPRIASVKMPEFRQLVHDLQRILDKPH